MDSSASITIGSSTLKFIDEPVEGKYHYCFLIPCNQIDEAVIWLSERLELIPVENNEIVAHFESWNAHSIYFYDGDGNIAEFIARHDLNNESEEAFGIHSLLSVNEIGTPTKNIRSLNKQLSDIIGSKYWKGDLDRFSTNGDQHGLFLLPNYEIKKTWYPTDIELKTLPYYAIIIEGANEFEVNYRNEIMEIRLL